MFDYGRFDEVLRGFRLCSEGIQALLPFPIFGVQTWGRFCSVRGKHMFWSVGPSSNESRQRIVTMVKRELPLLSCKLEADIEKHTASCSQAHKRLRPFGVCDDRPVDIEKYSATAAKVTKENMYCAKGTSIVGWGACGVWCL